MSYNSADLRPGMVILCLPDADEPWYDRLLDWAISTSSGGPFVHAALVGYGQLIEQIGPVSTSELSKYAANGWAYTVQGAPESAAHGAISWALHHLGAPYGIRALLDDGLYYDAHVSAELTADPQRVTCSGFVERAWRLGGGHTLTHQPLPSPMSLAFSPRLLGRRPWERHPA